jgi:hypothetical protein
MTIKLAHLQQNNPSQTHSKSTLKEIGKINYSGGHNNELQNTTGGGGHQVHQSSIHLIQNGIDVGG